MKKTISLCLVLFFHSSLQAKSLDPKLDVMIYRNGLMAINSFVKSNPDLFPEAKPDKTHVLNREQKEKVWSTWQSYLQYMLALDSIGEKNRPANVLTWKKDQRSFLIYYTAFLAKYRNTLDFIKAVDMDSDLTVLLNEPVIEFDLPKGTFDKIKFQFLNLMKASEFAALETVYKTMDASMEPQLHQVINEDARQIWAAGQGTGPSLTLKNAFQIVGKTGFGVWFPIQMGVAGWMGDTKVYRLNESLISPDQITALINDLEPGDILIERREWYLSNVGLPGYWPHAALYIGTQAERVKYFDSPDVRKWLAKKGFKTGNFEEYLQTTYPTAYERSQLMFENHVPRVLEAISEGVTFTSIEHSASADALAVLRPKLSKVEKAEAIFRSFHYSGRPYDFNFDFRTDSELVCSELVYKAYEPSRNYPGLKFQLTDMLGRKVLPPNEIVRIFDHQYGTEKQQLDFVIFLDGNEKKKNASEADVSVFRKSFTRPKWHIVTQNR